MDEPYSESNLDEAIEISLETVKKRAIKGVAILFSRGLILSLVGQFAWIFLLGFLDPAEMGVFFIVNAAVSFLIYFSDIGLAAALIQKKEKPTTVELRTTFTIQQLLIVLIIILLIIISPFLADYYNLSQEGIYLLYALGISLFLSSLKSIPSVLLERKLEFGKFVMPEIIENFVYNVLLVYLAWQGFGIMSFTYAVLARGIVGVVVIYILQPWKPGIAFSKSAIKGLLRFGVPYQANTLVSVFKDQGITLILGGILGASGVGLIGTAMRITQIPLRLVMDNVTKVSFPAFSRMQDNKNELAKTVTLSIKFITFIVFPSIVGLILMAPIMIELFPRYSDWAPVLVPLTIVSINTLFAAVATQLTNLFTATGRIKLTIKITIMYTVLTLLLVPNLAKMYGINGAAMAYTIVGISSIVPIIIARKIISYSLIESVLKPGTAAFGMGIFLYVLINIYTPNNVPMVMLTILMASTSYALFSFLLMGQSIVNDVKKFSKSIFSK